MPINWTTTFSIIGAFGAASTAQVVSHRLTQKREEEKYLKECLQKLYSPLIFRIIYYLDSESNNNILKDEFNNEDDDEIKNHIVIQIKSLMKYWTK